MREHSVVTDALRRYWSSDSQPPARLFVDDDGVEWVVEYCDPQGVRRRMPGGGPERPGLVFSSSAMVFHQPMRHRVDPRVLTTSQLNSMVERAYD